MDKFVKWSLLCVAPRPVVLGRRARGTLNDCLLLLRVWEHMKVLLLLFASGVAWMGPPRRPMNVPRAVAEPEVLRPESVEELDVDALEWKLLKSMRQRTPLSL